MITLAYPFMLLLLILPWLVRIIFPAYSEERPSLRVPFLKRLEEASGDRADSGQAVRRMPRLKRVLTWVIWVLVVVGLSRPQWIGEVHE